MKNYPKQFSKLFVGIAVLLFVACSSVSSDAKKAAKYANQSIEKTNELKLQEAEKLYKKSQKIIKKYESGKKSAKFFELYQQYRDKGKTFPKEQDA